MARDMPTRGAALANSDEDKNMVEDSRKGEYTSAYEAFSY